MDLKNLTNKYFAFLDRQSQAFNVAIGVYLTLLLGYLDYFLDTITKVDFTLAFFYLIPVSFVAWFAGRNAGIALSLLAAIIKMLATPTTDISIYLSIWRNLTSLAFFLIVALLVAKQRQLLDQERAISRTDHLTTVANSRAFLEVLTSEVFRQHRHFLQRGHYHPFGLAYIDIDDFKKINDSFGHATGDVVLKTAATTIARNLRRSDVVARLGGDEFAILLPDADAEAGLGAMEKIREQLQITMQQQQLPVTFSIGLLTCPEPPEIADEVLAFADNLMYEVKKTGKNSVRHAVYSKNRQGPGGTA